MKRMMKSATFVSCATLALFSVPGFSGPTRVGNGDDGGDLESAVEIRSGVLVETRLEAVKKLKALQVSAVEGLGLLIPEVEKAEMYLVGQNIDLSKTEATAEQKSDALEVAQSIGAVGNQNQLVYARTFAEPHAATRFFPASLLLDRNQLIALHIHEALHRALPAGIRENEKSVSRITLAIAAKDSTFDRVKSVVAKEMKAHGNSVSATGSSKGEGTTTEEQISVLRSLNRARHNTVEYSYRSFFMPESTQSAAPISALHSLKSFMYPFGSSRNDQAGAFGFGLEFTYVGLTERWYLGPVGLSTRLRIAEWNDFEVQLFSALHLNTLSAGEIKDIPVGRDTGTFGVAVRREDELVRIENQIYFVPGSEAQQTVGGASYTHRYGSSLAVRFSALGKFPSTPKKSFELGGMAEVLLSGPYEVTGAGTTSKTDRIRVVSVGPEFGYRVGDFRFSLNGRFVVDSTRDVSLDQLGDLLGQGVGQGSVGAAAAWNF
ncbi:MAG: hypothetical protein J0L82_00625 [Deltaproteobacteria bacterium]|nr:hypothetical protein [Deltaproteobacteria bacterium]